MYVFQLISLGSILLFSTSTIAQRWAPFTSEEGEFTIMAPGGTFDIETIDWETEYGIVVPAKVHKAVTDQGTFTLTVVDYYDSLALHEKRIEETGGLYIGVYGEVDVRASIAYVARQIREAAESVEYDNYHYIGRVDGHQLHTTNPDGTRTFAGLYLLESKLYVIEARINPGQPPGGMFQQSLAFIDESGNSIFFDSFRQPRKVREGGEWPTPTR
ncbi:MAG: hypothetical protein ACJ0S4_04055 [Candidatus Rariloculaceae bacterium]